MDFETYPAEVIDHDGRDLLVGYDKSGERGRSHLAG